MNRRNSLGAIVSVAFGSGFAKNLLDEHKNLSEIEKIACKYFILCSNWCSNLKINKLDYEFMVRIENHINIPKPGMDDFRRSIMTFIGTLYIKKLELCWDFHPILAEAFKKELENN